MIVDLQAETVQDEWLDADICIIGSGVAGLVFANEWFDSDKKVVVLESGGRTLEAPIQRLYTAVSVGVSYVGALLGRFRVFGGSSTKWGAQLLPFNREDFRDRPWILGSEWPISYDELRPYYDRSIPIMGADDLPYEAAALRRHLPEIPAWESGGTFNIRYSKFAPFNRRNLAKTLERPLTQSRHVHVVLHASLTRILFDSSTTTVTGVEVRTSSGQVRQVRCRQLVICAGTLETTRILLSGAPDVFPDGVGNASDLVGRYFQDHVSFRAGEVVPLQNQRFEQLITSHFYKRTRHYPRFELSYETQKRESLLNVFGHVGVEYPSGSLLIKLREWLRAFQNRQRMAISFRDVGRVVTDGVYVFRLMMRVFFGGVFPFMSGSKFVLQVDTEQCPNPESRVSLSDVVDDYGVRQLCIDWRLTEEERRGVMWFCEQLKQEFESTGLAQVHLDATRHASPDRWLHNVSDIYHPAGTTRMHPDPARGVVDANLKIHGLTNMFVASCSVFPASAGANPTFTLMALCIRLADHLKKKLGVI